VPVVGLGEHWEPSSNDVDAIRPAIFHRDGLRSSLTEPNLAKVLVIMEGSWSAGLSTTNSGRIVA
jgi:hypothetical protein